MGVASRAERHKVGAALPAKVYDANAMAVAVLKMVFHRQLSSSAERSIRPLLEASQKGVAVLLLELRCHVGSRSSIVEAVPRGPKDVEYVQCSKVARCDASGLRNRFTSNV